MRKAEATRPKRALPWARPALALGSVIVSLLALELVFRLLGLQGDYPPPRTDRFGLPPGQTMQQNEFGLPAHLIWETSYASDPRAYFEPGNTITHVHNSVGWRDGEHLFAKPPGTLRILGLGDSYLWGQGVRSEDICLSKLEGLLDEAIPELRVETINTGRSGTNTVEQGQLLLARGLRYDPDLVIVHFVPNDVEQSLARQGAKIEFLTDYTSIYQEEDRLSKYSALWGWSRQLYLRGVRGRAHVRQSVESFSEDSLNWQTCRQGLIDIRDVCAARGTGLLVVVFPFFHDLDGDYPFQTIHDVVRRHCESNGIPVLDLRDQYREYRGPELWVHATDQHPNEIAHDIAARAMADYLKAHPDLLRPRPSGSAPSP